MMLAEGTNWIVMILTLLWTALNSPLGLGLAATGLVVLLKWIYGKKPDWQQYQGTIIDAVKRVEKEIPDDTPSAGAARLDAALKYVLTVFEEANKRQATEKEVLELTQGIQVTHAELEAADTLNKTKTMAVSLLLFLALSAGLCLGGCQVICVTPPDGGTVNVGATNSAVTTESQTTESHQTPEAEGTADVVAD